MGQGRAAAALLAALALLAPLSVAAGAPQSAFAGSTHAELRREIGERAPKDLRGFYAARGNRPVWLAANGRPGPAAAMLLGRMESAEADGLDPDKLKPQRLARALDKAMGGTTDDLARAELEAAQAYVRYVQALRKAPRTAMIYETQALAPAVPTAAAALQRAAEAISLVQHVNDMGWMHPFYAPLRAALMRPGLTAEQRRIVAINLARVRALPPIAEGRWVLIDAASARLWMYDGAKLAGTMKVVVGRPETPTPEMAGFLRQAVVNPYWNLPDDLVPSRITDKVLASGPGYVKANGFQVLSGWHDDAELLDPRDLDWDAVAQGQQTIRVRQLPGPGNFMGAVKFMFPNNLGIYLHDTPERDLLLKSARQFSNGCVRLEAAGKFGRWVLGRPLPRSREPERRIDLPVPVPLYITYLTAMPEGGTIRFRPDPYRRDAAQLAQLARR